MTYLMALLGFAFVIFIHELGHFVFAKWAGVRVDTFSIGMGPVIWSKTIGETEYAISLLPVGGYVKMLGQEDVPGRAVDADNERSFQRKHPAWRAAILFGGVLFNLISSYLILVALAWTGVPVFPPVVGELQQHFLAADGSRIETPAWRLGLQQGDRILSINDKPVRSYQDLLMRALGAETGTAIRMTIERDGRQLELPQGPQEAI
ncbi:MAG: M50 family metallopeptidase, partial [Planctomycetota bacterium]